MVVIRLLPKIVHSFLEFSKLVQTNAKLTKIKVSYKKFSFLLACDSYKVTFYLTYFSFFYSLQDMLVDRLSILESTLTLKNAGFLVS